MLTKNEVNSIQLSATKKDFYQIWGELTEIADKLSERWDVSSTNESDPGIVLLKVLTAVADKLNYAIDKNTLEAFMPSAAQEESMRKLCAMLGYSMKYYRSAETTVTAKWIGKKDKETKSLVLDDGTPIAQLTLPQFTVFKNADENITYVTKKEALFSYANLSNEIDVIEGEVVQCESENDNIISIDRIDDSHRFYLPETQIAENGIFIYSVNDGTVSKSAWEKVDNLNASALGTKCYKFGFDSQEGLPYIQFPEDISTIIEDGLEIYFIRTTGVNGNVSAGTLSTMNGFEIGSADSKETISPDYFGIANKNASFNGANAETISGAYESYKKTIGTFDTLVTCRDYMNKICTLLDDHNLPLVSNAIVSDIRDDINRSITLCSFDEYGISYETKPIQENEKDLIDHFTLIVYPFKTAHDSGTKSDFRDSFTFSDANFNEIEVALDKYKTISHKLTLPESNDICCVKNYLKVKAIITTTTKVNALAQKSILENIYSALYKEFNLRHLNFGDELLSDAIYETIQNADNRIKFVSLDDPQTETRIYTRNGEYSVGDETYKKLMNKLIVRNVLAGKMPLFNYYEDFKPELSEKLPAGGIPSVIDDVAKLTAKASIQVPTDESHPVVLLDNEVIQFMAPNFKTDKTISAYVNYYFIRNSATADSPYIAARMKALSSWLSNNWTFIYQSIQEESMTKIASAEAFAKATEYGYVIVEPSTVGLPWIKTADRAYNASKTYYFYPMNSSTFANWVKSVKSAGFSFNDKTYNYAGVFEQKGSDANRLPGYLVDVSCVKYVEKTTLSTIVSPAYCDLRKLYVQDINTSDSTKSLDYASGLGKDGVAASIPANSDYQLKDGEYLYINYTQSSTSGNSDGTNADKEIEVSTFFGPGAIIRPNFALPDSEKYKTTSGKSWPKSISTSKIFKNDDEESTTATKTLSAGHMWTLGSDEQIEIRKLDETVLRPDDENDSENVYVFWETNDGRNDFFGEKPEVILGENEYFFLTDADRSGLVYYGSGTVITKTGNVNLEKSEKSTVAIADVLEYGIDALESVWVKATVSAKNNIAIKSCQFINLTGGDSLARVDCSVSTLTNEFKKCTGAKYTLSGTESELPTIDVDGCYWQVRSKLEFNMGPSLTQTLSNERDTITYATKDGTSKELTGNASAPLSIKSNYLCQTSADEIDAESILAKYREDSAIDVEPLRLSCASVNEVKCSFGDKSASLTLGNFGDKWTKFSFSEESAGGIGEVNLNVKLPFMTGYYALLMVYYMQAADKQAYLTTDDSSNGISIFNNDGKWWDGDTSSGYKLRNGLNIVKIVSSSTIKICNVNDDDSFIFGQLDIVKEDINANDQGLNVKLLGYDGSGTALLSDISALDPDHSFYYNNAVASSEMININADLGESLLSPSCWYDPNNVNNKFVVCEIDPDYIKTGITIANSSKLK